MASENWTEERPWGRFRNLLDSDFTKVKLLEVDPGKRLSYQSHSKREESWPVVRGEALVVLDDKDIRLKVGEHIQIPVHGKHRLENPGSTILSLVEV